MPSVGAVFVLRLTAHLSIYFIYKRYDNYKWHIDIMLSPVQFFTKLPVSLRILGFTNKANRKD